MERDPNETAVRLLAMREHSRLELQRKLLQKGFAESKVVQVLQDLSEQNLLSDERFTEAFVMSKRERGAGPVKIRAELQQRGIEPALVEQYLDFRDPVWLEQAEQARQKKYGQGLPQDYSGKMQQARFLANRGFSHEQIRRVLDAEFESG
ncbi:MAG: regulatory protein RecX [Gammaproteobacteria bacterium]|jgi:regulatory protein